MKQLFAVFIFLTCYPAFAQVNITCGGSAAAITCDSTAVAVTSNKARLVTAPNGEARPSVELKLDNISNDLVFLQALPESPTGLVSILTSNHGVKTDYQINAPGAFANGVSKDADTVNILGDVFGKLTVNIGGYSGADGLPLAKQCLQKVNSGFFGNPSVDDSIIQYAVQNSSTSCDLGLLSKIAASAPPQFCPSGFSYFPDLEGSTSQSFIVKRRKFMNECVGTITAACGDPSPNGCIANGGLFTPDYVYVTLGNSCPSGYSLSGPTQEYPCPHKGDDPNCDSNTENVVCSTTSCQQATLKESFQTVYGATITREKGQVGSYGGNLNVLAYDVDLSSYRFANGSNGRPGVSDLTQQSTSKFCVRILDNSSPDLEPSAPERNTPSVYLHHVEFFPLLVLEPSGTSNTNYPVRSEAEAVGVFKKMDSSVRDYVFKSIISTAP
jgi:hypothetical protein